MNGRVVGSLPFPAIYNEEDGDTGLTATVKTEPTQLEPFKLTPPAAKRRQVGGRRGGRD